MDVIGCLMRGMTIEDSAKQLGIAKRTVKALRHRVFTKFQISGRYVKQVRLVHLIYRHWWKLKHKGV